MGWTAYDRPPGEKDIDHLRRELFEFSDGSDPYELLDGMTVRNVFYGAVRTKADGKVWALVVLQKRGKSAGYGNYARKEMEESMGPYENHCPARILDLLTDPAPNEYAAEWRERCRANLARRASRAKLKLGDTFRMARKLTFADGGEDDTFTLINAKRRWYRRASDGRTVRLGARDGWPDYEVVTA